MGPKLGEDELHIEGILVDREDSRVKGWGSLKGKGAGG